MRISVRFVKSDIGEASAVITLDRGTDDPAIISIDGMARSFAEGARIEVGRKFGRHAGKEAKEWAETAVADIKHQIDEYRTTVPADYGLEY